MPEHPPPLPPDPGIVHVVGAAIIDHARCLVARRKADGSAGGKWEFPGGKVELGETPEIALEREIQEEFGETILVTQWLGRGIERQSARLIVLDVYQAIPREPWKNRELRAHDEARWVHADALSEFDWARADVPIVPCAIQLLQGLQNRTTRSRNNG